MINDLEELRRKAVAELNQAETEEALLTIKTRYQGHPCGGDRQRPAAHGLEKTG